MDQKWLFLAAGLLTAAVVSVVSTGITTLIMKLRSSTIRNRQRQQEQQQRQQQQQQQALRDAEDPLDQAINSDPIQRFGHISPPPAYEELQTRWQRIRRTLPSVSQPVRRGSLVCRELLLSMPPNIALILILIHFYQILLIFV